MVHEFQAELEMFGSAILAGRFLWCQWEMGLELGQSEVAILSFFRQIM
jgi:hypothetical protein